MSELSRKLASRLSAAVRTESLDRPDSEEGWNIVSDTIELMIEKAVLELERRLNFRMVAERPSGWLAKPMRPIPHHVEEALKLLEAGSKHG